VAKAERAPQHELRRFFKAGSSRGSSGHRQKREHTRDTHTHTHTPMHTAATAQSKLRPHASMVPGRPCASGRCGGNINKPKRPAQCRHYAPPHAARAECPQQQEARQHKAQMAAHPSNAAGWRNVAITLRRSPSAYARTSLSAPGRRNDRSKPGTPRRPPWNPR